MSTRVASVKIDGAERARRGHVVTDFAGNREPSIEDDVVYLDQEGGALADLQAEHGAVPRDRRGRHPADGPRPAEVIVS